MRTTIDGAGRLVVPKAIRDRLGLVGGSELEITERDGRIELEPAPSAIRLVPKGDILVAEPTQPLPPLPTRSSGRRSSGSGGDRGRRQCGWWRPSPPGTRHTYPPSVPSNGGVHLVAHAALETYSVLTRLPPPHRVAPEAVHTFLGGISSLPWLTLGPAAQLDLLRNLAREAIAGGAVYDALVGATSTAAGATLLTRDVRAGRTYRRLGVAFELLA